MDEKIKGLIVTLEDGISEECHEEILNAIYMVKGVIDVSKVSSEGSFHESLVARQMCAQMKEKVQGLIEDIDEMKP